MITCPDKMAHFEALDRNQLNLTFADICHGHITVRRRTVGDVFQRDDALYSRSDDSKYVRDLFALKKRVIRIDSRLCLYLE